MIQLNKKNFIILFLLIILTGAILRFSFLEVKPLHHDEGELQFYYIDTLANHQPLDWDYDNKGLFRHYITYAISVIIGFTTFSLRFVPALFGILSIAILYFLKDKIGSTGVLVSAAFLAVSPVMVYYSKMYTTYPFYVFFILLLLVLMVNFNKSQYKNWHVILIGLICSIILNINLEAFILFLVIVLIFIFLNFLFSKNYAKKIFKILKAVPIKIYIYSLIIFIVSFIFFHTSLFLNFNNLFKIIDSLIQLSNKAVETGHNKSFIYYFTILIPLEISVFLISIIGLIFFKKNQFSRFIIFWSVSSIIIFSLIPYKANWVLYAMIFPLFLLAGNTIDYLVNKFPKYKLLILCITFVYILLSSFFSINQNFINLNNFEKNKLGYVETSTDIFNLINDIEKYDYDHDTKILISGSSYWPLPSYLKKYSPMYLGDIKEIAINEYSEYNVFINDNFNSDHDLSGFEIKKYELRENYNINVIFKK